MKLQNLYIENFRHIKDTTIEFGEKITVISGQNGTGKSSVLGWVAQLCKYKGAERQLNGDKFDEEWMKIFKFCTDFDFSNSYKVVFKYINDGIDEEKELSTRLTVITNSARKRYRADYNRNKKEGKVAVNFPIIYLGLKRLIPLATEEKIEKNPIKLSQEESNIFNAFSKEVLLLVDDNIKIDSVKSSNKKVMAMKTNSYSHLGNSAGQDNLGQVIAAILSFKRLKQELGVNYKGGILLIDELDATLYAASQVKLVDKLIHYARNLNLQIVFTTHSIEILEHLSKKTGEGTKINYLKTIGGKTESEINPSIEYIKRKILALRGDKTAKPEKINIICEDSSAELWIKNLIKGTELNDLVKPCGANLPKGNLKNLAESPNKQLKKNRYILDGDVRKDYVNKAIPKNICFLPTENGVEVEMYHYIKQLSDLDNFWDDEFNLTKQTCFMNHQNGSNQNIAKSWFENDDLKRDFFGRGYSKLFNKWQSNNKEKAQQFLNDLKNII